MMCISDDKINEPALPGNLILKNQIIEFVLICRFLQDKIGKTGRKSKNSEAEENNTEAEEDNKSFGPGRQDNPYI